jgi:H+/Cl- antiporter ClcA
VISNVTLSAAVPPMPRARAVDILSAIVIATIAAALGLIAVYLFPVLHAAFHRLPHPLLMLTFGGLVLGLLAAAGGELTMFKGLTEMQQLTATASSHSTGNLLFLALIKIGALLVAATSGFRGGRIFPAVFIGAALGLCAHSAVTSIPPSLAVAAGILGFVLATSKQGFLSLLLATTVVADVTVLPLLCVAILPAWLLITGRPEMLVVPKPAAKENPA